MAPKFHNALTGRLKELRPASPPGVDILWDGERGRAEGSLGCLRARVWLSSLLDALSYIGYAPRLSAGGPVDLFCGDGRPPAEARLWLRLAAGAEAAAPRGFREEDLRLFCLQTHYRKPLPPPGRALETAREDLTYLREAARRLEAGGGPAPNPKGLAGYRKRFRDALGSDLDTPAALASVWDALRPGALSPGSQLGVLQDAEKVFKLNLFSPKK